MSDACAKFAASKVRRSGGGGYKGEKFIVRQQFLVHVMRQVSDQTKLTHSLIFIQNCCAFRRFDRAKIRRMRLPETLDEAQSCR